MAASLVICGAVWSYFLNPSTRQVTYAPVILIGFGMSVMYVMALTFITDLIGENKVSDLGPSYMVSGTRDNPPTETTLVDVYM